MRTFRGGVTQVALNTLSLRTRVTRRKNWVRKDSFKERECPGFIPPGCSEGKPICREETPKLVDVGGGHYVACHLSIVQ